MNVFWKTYEKHASDFKDEEDAQRVESNPSKFLCFKFLEIELILFLSGMRTLIV